MQRARIFFAARLCLSCLNEKTNTPVSTLDASYEDRMHTFKIVLRYSQVSRHARDINVISSSGDLRVRNT